jgi:hypothetical protein
VDKIRDTDVTYFLYELAASSTLETLPDDAVDDEPVDLSISRNPDRLKLPVEELSKLNQGDAWRKRVFDEYITTQLTLMSTLFNPTRATKDALVRFYTKLHDFLAVCYKELQLARSTYEQQGDSDDSDDDDNLRREDIETLVSQGLQEGAQFHALFKNVTKASDVY